LSAAAENLRPERGVAPQNPAVARGFGRGPRRSRTRDSGFRAPHAPRSAIVSVAEFGGSDSRVIRLIDGRELHHDT
jgi:hypothetical protein